MRRSFLRRGVPRLEPRPKTVIIAKQGIGEFFMSLPAIRCVSEQERFAPVLILVGKECLVEYVRGQAWATHTTALVMTRENALGLALEIRRCRPATLLFMLSNGSIKHSALTCIVGARRSFGASLGGRSLVFDECVDLRERLHKSELSMQMVLRAAGTEAAFCCRDVREAEGMASNRVGPGDRVVLAPGSGEVERHKRWPAARYVELGRYLLENRPSVTICILGSSGEKALLQEIGHPLSRDYRGRVEIQTPDSLEATIDALRSSSLLVAGCTGTIHIGAYTGVPIVGIYGPTNPNLTGPVSPKVWIVRKGYLCSPCYSTSTVQGCGNPVCIADITVGEVVAAVEAMLEGQVPPRLRWRDTTKARHPDRRVVVGSEETGRDSRGPSGVVRERPHQICNKCVMDTTDTWITFDGDGVCDHCKSFERHVRPNWDTGASGLEKLATTTEQIRRLGRDSDFDCIVGLSGGVDSSYMLHVAVVDLGLRPLVFHVDGGWNSETAVHNINVVVAKLGLDLITEVIHWEEMRDLQLAFFKAGVPHVDIPQDHAFIATLYRFAEQYGIKYILNGGNYSTECVRNPMKWLYYGTDMWQINDIIQKFGTVPMSSYPFSPIFRHKIYLRYLKGVRVVKPLNSVPYVKSEAEAFLRSEYGYKTYPQKHFESRFTRFCEGFWLPERFGFDTRKVQYSSLILTGQMTRAEALDRLAMPAIDAKTAEHEFEYVSRKLRISPEELRGYFTMPLKFYWDYRNMVGVFDAGARVLRAFGLEGSVKR